MDTTLLKGLAVLENLAGRGDSIVIDDLAAELGLTRSNAHRTLQTLVHAGYVERDLLQGGYRTTTKLFTLGILRAGQLEVHRLAPPFLIRLAGETGETIHLGMLEGAEVVYIDKIDSRHAIGAYAAIGGRAPVHATATGKALLAAVGPDYLRHLPRSLKRHTEATITDADALKVELGKITRVGFAIDRGEWRTGVGGVGAAVINGLGRPVAALGVCGPLHRLTLTRMKQLGPMLLNVASQLSRAMGYTAAGKATGT